MLLKDANSASKLSRNCCLHKFIINISKDFMCWILTSMPRKCCFNGINAPNNVSHSWDFQKNLKLTPWIFLILSTINFWEIFYISVIKQSKTRIVPNLHYKVLVLMIHHWIIKQHSAIVICVLFFLFWFWRDWIC